MIYNPNPRKAKEKTYIHEILRHIFFRNKPKQSHHISITDNIPYFKILLNR